MIKLLAGIFIKNADNFKDVQVRYKYGVLCGIAGIALNILLFISKYLAGVLSGSIAITADSFNNLSDAGSSLITLIGFKLAKSKPDPEHPFGHGRIEYLSGLGVSFLILLMGFELAKSSIEKIMNPQDIETGLVAFLVMAISICIKFYMSVYNKSIGKKIDSGAMLATAKDSLSDCIATFAVIVSMLVLHFTDVNIDGICGLLVALMIMLAGISSVKETIGPLLGQKPDAELVENIQRDVMENEYVLGIHDMVVHDYGPGRMMVSLHAEVDGKGDIFVLHDAIDTIESKINEKFCCETVIHMDPIIVDDEEINTLKHKISQTLKEYNEKIKLHDFRVVKGPTHTNVIFDAVVPFDIKQSDIQIKRSLEQLISSNFENTFAVIKIDKDYV